MKTYSRFRAFFHRTKVSIPRVGVVLFLLFEIQADQSAQALWAEISLLQRVVDADLIVVGKLITVDEEAIEINYANYRGTGKERRYLLNTGVLLADSTLMWPPMMGLAVRKKKRTEELPFAFFSARHPQPGGCSYIMSAERIGFEEGQEGIWVLNWGHMVDYLTVIYPTNFMPIDSLDVVLQTIDQANTLLEGGSLQRSTDTTSSHQ